ncbi:hypothetical protein MF271_05100 [Deinococcus sp. KNUC1210]|uniref:hypothetical protein n=1 Tax=Deinococcus sp. KNUC1210 TaxID=2917691 RepID=UPI001EF1349F|nr:hypothetical protein [Deinococcus sp. KNUC1210]ULH16013.1 hypothetical protein MF271_05100 [Deinococcus sp. KNUC1210]
MNLWLVALLALCLLGIAALFGVVWLMDRPRPTFATNTPGISACVGCHRPCADTEFLCLNCQRVQA